LAPCICPTLGGLVAVQLLRRSRQPRRWRISPNAPFPIRAFCLSPVSMRRTSGRWSERDVVVGGAAELGYAGVVGRDRGAHLLAVSGTGTGACGGSVTAAEQLHVGRHDLRGVPLLTLLVLPLAGPDAAFHVDLTALRAVLPHD